MLSNLGQIFDLMRNAGKIKQNMGEMGERLAAARFIGEAGGQVKATVDGRGEMVSIKIDPAAVQAGDIEMLEDLICAAIREAVRQSRTGAQKEMETALGGMNLGPMMDMLGGGKP